MSDDAELPSLTGGPEDVPDYQEPNPSRAGTPGVTHRGTSTDRGEQLSLDLPARTEATDAAGAAPPASAASERDDDEAPGGSEGMDMGLVPADDAGLLGKAETASPGSAGEAAGPVLDPIEKAIAAELARIRLQKKLTWAVALGAVILPIVCFALFPPSGVFEGKDDSNLVLAGGRSDHGRAAIVTSTTQWTKGIRENAPGLGLLTTTSTTRATAPAVGISSTSTRLTTTTNSNTITTSSSTASSSRTASSSTTTITSTTSTSTTTSTTTTRPPQQPRRLGSIDWSRWCQSAGFVRASLDQQNGYGWFCVDGQGGRHGIDTFEACERQYGVPDGLAVGQLTNYHDPNSWVCWRINRYLGTLTESGFRSWCRSAGYADIRLNGPTAYDWDCVDSAGRFGGPDTRESCRYVYSSPNAIEVLANFFDPGGWRCYT